MPTPNEPNRQCPRCGTALTDAALSGLCPQCLVKVTFGEEAEATRIIRPGDVTPQSLLPATVRYFGDYELLDEIARGGMGVVYRARQVSLNRVVAVKMILAGQFANEAEVKRFRAEAEAAAKLQHPNIVAIHEVGEHSGRNYFSMDLVNGPTLAELVKDGPLPAGKAVQYLKTIAETVEFAHQRGILHRDLKPSNVLVDSDDRPRVTDFGLAKVMHSDSSLTRTGDVMGSPAFMPPEQAQGKASRMGPASDVYSLGAVLYFLLTGRAPFEGATAVEVLRQVIDDEPVKPSRLNAKVPSDLEIICLKCFAKDPAQRYGSARELAEDLGRFLNYEPILAKPAGGVRRVWNWTQKNPWAVAGGFALLLLAMAGVAYGFWERLRYLDWHLQTKMESARDIGNSPSMPFLMGLPLLMLLVYVSRRAFRRHYQARSLSGAGPSSGVLLAHAGLGLFAILAGLIFLFLQIRCWAWNTSVPWALAFEIGGISSALVLNWLGFQMLWESVGIHETSRFRNLVDKAMEEELKRDERRWPGWKLILLSFWFLFVLALPVGLFGLYLTGEENQFTYSVLAAAIGLGAGAEVLWVMRQRRRLFTYVFAPGAVGLLVFVLGALHLDAERTLGYLFIAGITLTLTVTGGFLLRRPEAAAAERRRFPGNVWLDALGGMAVFIGLMIAFHLVENWRGAREWKRVKADLEAKGESLDYSTFLKPRVPNDQNVMAHPFMKERMIKGSKGLTLTHPPYSYKLLPGHPYLLRDLKALPRQPNPAESVLTLAGGLASREIIPRLSFTNQPLGEIFFELARRAGVTVEGTTNDRPWVTIQRSKGQERRTGVMRAFHGSDIISGSKEQERLTPRLIWFTYTNMTALSAINRLTRSFRLAADQEVWKERQVLRMKDDDQPTLQSILNWYSVYHRKNFAQLEEALQRPYSQLTPDPLRPWSNSMPNFVAFRTASQIYAELCKINLLMGNTNTALKNLQTLRRLADTVQANEPPTVVEVMIKSALVGLLAATVEETMAEGLWPVVHLERVQKLCEGTELLGGFTLCMRGGERAAVLRWVETETKEDKGRFLVEGIRFDAGEEPKPKALQLLARLAVPDGWIDQNKASYARLMQYSYAWLDSAQQRVNPEILDGNASIIEGMVQGYGTYRPYVYYANFTVPNFTKSGFALAKNQTRLNQSFIACALERHRAAKGAYPDTLAALVPEFAAKLPHDLFDGQPLRYRRTDDGKYLLYSLGWNAKDDGGTVTLDKNQNPDWDKSNDWAWLGVPKK